MTSHTGQQTSKWPHIDLTLTSYWQAISPHFLLVITRSLTRVTKAIRTLGMAVSGSSRNSHRMWLMRVSMCVLLMYMGAFISRESVCVYARPVLYVCIQIYPHVWMVCARVCVCVRAYVHVCVCVSVHVDKGLTCNGCHATCMPRPSLFITSRNMSVYNW